MLLRKVLLISVLCLFTVEASAGLINIADGKTVTLNGAYGVMVRPNWLPGPLAPAATLTDGVFLPEQSIWQTDTVWWDTANQGSGNNSIEVDLGGFYNVRGFIVQADNNETYRVQYQDMGGIWVDAWDAGPIAGFGMMTRPNTLDTSEIAFLASSVKTDRLRLFAFGGDGFYGVSEIQAFVPEPGTVSLLFIGIALPLARRFRGRSR